MPTSELEINDVLNKFTIMLVDPPTGFKIELKGIDEMITFFEKEKSFWDSISSNFGVINAYRSAYKLKIDNLKQFKTELSNWNESIINQQWVRTKNEVQKIDTAHGYRLLFSSTPHAVFVLDNYLKNDPSAEYIHEYLIQYGFNLSNREYFKGYLKANHFLESLNSTEQNVIEYSDKTKQQVINDWRQNTEEINNKYSTFTNDVNMWKEELKKELTNWNEDRKTQVSDFIQKGNIDLQNLESTYTQKLKLEGPVVYWTNSASKFKTRGRIYLSLLTIVSLILLIILFSVLYNPPNSFSENILQFKPNTIKGLLVFATIVSIGLALIRILFKLTLSSFHLRIDSEEREKLTMVYLALFDSKKISEKERQLVLESLFSRADTGLLSGDSSPTMPGNFTNLFIKPQN